MGYLTGAILLALGALIPTIYHDGLAVPQKYVTTSYFATTPAWGRLWTNKPPPMSGLHVEVLSTSPLLLSINDFVSPREIQHLLNLGQPLFKRSMVTGGKISAGRTSDSCFLPGSDDVVSIIKQRAAMFMRGLNFDGLEAIQLVRYTANQTIDLHYDWHQGTLPLDRSRRPYNRLASFFIYLQADCKGGETWFPNVTMSSGNVVQNTASTNERVSLQVGEHGKGIIARAQPGSGLFWMNLEGNSGDRRVMHAGLPVHTGTKVGMNIWVKKNMD